jgi:luciferase family oxidoreductase group 1
MVTLSVLDQSPIREGGTGAQALRESIDLARECERFGYERYWVAEHHSGSSFAGSAPEILIGAIASATNKIRVGSGGVMLPHYSPLKVAETFRVLEALYPGRVDLGLGRAPGSDQKTSRALQPGPQAYGIDVFPQQIELLTQFLEDAQGLEGDQGGFPPEHPYKGIHAVPAGPGMPGLWMLGSSTDGAMYAAQFGMPFCFAHFINQDAGSMPLDLYRKNFRPSRIASRAKGSVGVSVTVAETEEEAHRISASRNLWVLHLLQNKAGPFKSIKNAQAFPLSEDEKLMMQGIEQRSITGTPEQVRAGLLQLGETYGVDDFVILTITHDHADRVKSYQLLAQAFNL